MSVAVIQTCKNEVIVDSLKQRIASQKDGLFVLPAVAMEAMQLTRDEECSLDDFACLVEKDVELTTSILALSNSAVFHPTSPVCSIRQAVVRLGLRQVRNLIMSVCAQGLMRSVSLKQEWIRELLWRHSFITATACVHMNRAFALGFQGEEFTAGLLHDFGRIALAVIAENDFFDADPLDFIEAEGFMEFEQRVLGTDHCEFGASVARDMGLPEQLAESIQWHHDPQNELVENKKLVLLVAAADHMANHIQRYDEAEPYVLEADSAIQNLCSQYGSFMSENIAAIADQLVNEVRALAFQSSSNTDVG